MGRESDDVSWHQPPRRTADVTGVSSACSGHYATIPDAVWSTVWTDLTTSRYCAAYPLYFSPLQNPRQAWATTLGRGTALDQGETAIGSTLGAQPCQMRGTAHLYSHRHAIDWRHRAGTRTGPGQRDSQGRRSRPASRPTAISNRSCQLSPPRFGEKGTTPEDHAHM